MEKFAEGALEISMETNGSVKMTWLGRSENRDPALLLNPYLSKIIDAIEGKKMEIDFTRFEYMNSSTVPPIIQMVKSLETKGISTKVIYNKDSKWQEASFKALQVITTKMKHIEVIGK